MHQRDEKRGFIFSFARIYDSIHIAKESTLTWMEKRVFYAILLNHLSLLLLRSKVTWDDQEMKEKQCWPRESNDSRRRPKGKSPRLWWQLYFYVFSNGHSSLVCNHWLPTQGKRKVSCTREPSASHSAVNKPLDQQKRPRSRNVERRVLSYFTTHSFWQSRGEHFVEEFNVAVATELVPAGAHSKIAGRWQRKGTRLSAPAGQPPSVVIYQDA